jgi:hypothetical protein
MKTFFCKASLALTIAAMLDVGAVALAQTRDPVGERADYVLDRDSSRTSSLVRSGSLVGYVVQYLPDNQPPAYDTHLDYSLRLQIFGSYNGSVGIPIDAPFFTPQFLEDLRVSGHYESPKFKIDHLGYEDATTLAGIAYPNCDVVRIYDIDYSLTQLGPMQAQQPLGGNEIDNLVIVAHIYYGVPVLGAVKLDISGTYQGIGIRVGADYQP